MASSRASQPLAERLPVLRGMRHPAPDLGSWRRISHSPSRSVLDGRSEGEALGRFGHSSSLIACPRSSPTRPASASQFSAGRSVSRFATNLTPIGAHQWAEMEQIGPRTREDRPAPPDSSITKGSDEPDARGSPPRRGSGDRRAGRRPRRRPRARRSSCPRPATRDSRTRSPWSSSTTCDNSSLRASISNAGASGRSPARPPARSGPRTVALHPERGTYARAPAR